MWDPLQRARRLLLRDDESDPTGEAVPSGSAEPRDRTLADLTFALGRGELDRLIGALEQLSDREVGRADTPARLEAALRGAIARAGGTGEPRVTRRPAGVYTPEAWQIAIDRADDRARTTIEAAIRTGGSHA